MCCKLVAVEEINKPAHQWCSHFAAGNGCLIYADRPNECRTFRCLWLMRAELGEHWRPDRSRIVLYFSQDGTHLIANVDPSRPGIWRQRPFHESLQGWARRGGAAGLEVIVKVGRRIFMVLPDRDVDLGQIGDEERFRITRVRSEEGVAILAQKIAAGDETAAG
jgi:hypothetical protein